MKCTVYCISDLFPVSNLDSFDEMMHFFIRIIKRFLKIVKVCNIINSITSQWILTFQSFLCTSVGTVQFFCRRCRISHRTCCLNLNRIKNRFLDHAQSIIKYFMHFLTHRVTLKKDHHPVSSIFKYIVCFSQTFTCNVFCRKQIKIIICQWNIIQIKIQNSYFIRSPLQIDIHIFCTFQI